MSLLCVSVSHSVRHQALPGNKTLMPGSCFSSSICSKMSSADFCSTSCWQKIFIGIWKKAFGHRYFLFSSLPLSFSHIFIRSPDSYCHTLYSISCLTFLTTGKQQSISLSDWFVAHFSDKCATDNICGCWWALGLYSVHSAYFACHRFFLHAAKAKSKTIGHFYYIKNGKLCCVVASLIIHFLIFFHSGKIILKESGPGPALCLFECILKCLEMQSVLKALAPIDVIMCILCNEAANDF